MREWLRELRGGKTCKEFGQKLGVSEQYYWLIEQGLRGKRMRVDLMTKIAKVTKKPIKRLMEAEYAYRENH